MSAFNMICQFLKTKDRVVMWLLECDTIDKNITREEWTKLEGIKKLLQPLEEIFKE